jgi:hypothetical protein
MWINRERKNLMISEVPIINYMVFSSAAQEITTCNDIYLRKDASILWQEYLVRPEGAKDGSKVERKIQLWFSQEPPCQRIEAERGDSNSNTILWHC